MRKTVKAGIVAAAVAGTLATSAGAAFADDCFNASRSAQGNVSAGTHSGNWYTVAEMIAAFTNATPEQTALALQYVADDPNIPANWTMFVIPTAGENVYELAQNAPVRLSTNGKGIDHSDAYPNLFPSLFADLTRAGISLG